MRSTADPIRLDGRVAVVTGASRGLGYAIAETLARHGATVVCAARSQGPLEEAVTRLRADGLPAYAHPCDVGDFAQVRALADAAQAYGNLDIWVNDAGSAGVFGPVASTPPEDFAHVVQTNILGTFHGCRAALPIFLAQGHGDLVNLYGRGDRSPVPLQAAYGSSKAWIRMFTRALQGEVKGSGVRVHGMNPGLVLTDMLGRVTSQPGFEEKLQALPVIASLWGQPPRLAARPVLGLVTSDRGEFIDLNKPTMITRGLRSWASGRLKRERRMPMSVTVLDAGD